MFRGAGDGFVDSQVVNGNRYAYEVRVVDAAGNVGSRTVRAVPGPRLIAPAAGAVVKRRKPPVLRWTPIRGARYYNVQLFRNGRKVLSAWPTQARLKLKRSVEVRRQARALRGGRVQVARMAWPRRAVEGRLRRADRGPEVHRPDERISRAFAIDRLAVDRSRRGSVSVGAVRLPVETSVPSAAVRRKR